MELRVVTLKLTDVSEVRAASETSINFNMTTRPYIPEDTKLRTRRRENLNSHERTVILARGICPEVERSLEEDLSKEQQNVRDG
jgi:hypothetical protein